MDVPRATSVRSKIFSETSMESLASAHRIIESAGSASRRLCKSRADSTASAPRHLRLLFTEGVASIINGDAREAAVSPTVCVVASVPISIIVATVYSSGK